MSPVAWTWISLLLALGALGLLLVIPRRRKRNIECPTDHKPRQVVFVGRSLELDRWDDVDVCERPDGEVRRGKEIHCAKKCAESEENAPRQGIVYWRGAGD